MQATVLASFSRLATLLGATFLLAGCFGEGDGPTRIPGTPAPPPPDIPAGFCDPINFEDVCGPVNFINFGGTATGAGGVSQIIVNPDRSDINPSAKVGQMQKFPGEVFAGSAIQLNEAINFAEGEAFTMKVWSQREVPVLFKLEDAVSGDPNLGKEETRRHGGSGGWEELCFDFSGDVTGFSSDRITLIFDLGVAGNAANNPGDWTFFFDDITQVASCGGGGADPVNLPVDFEADPANYDFGSDNGFAGGVATVIANPDRSGLNATAQTARMQKFADQPFGGATLSLSGDVNFASGTALKMKVWASRAVPVTFKFEDAVSGDPALGREEVVSHSGSGTWEELCFDFTGDTAGFRTNSITFIFDNGIVGDAANNESAWTFYFDQITQAASCAAPPPPPPPPSGFPTITFDDPAVTYTLTDFGGNASAVAADPVGGTNQVARIIRGADAQDWAGTTVSTLPGLAVPAIPFTASSTRMTVRTYSPDAGIKVRLKVEKVGDPTISVETEATTTVANGWETLTFDFANPAAGTAALNLANTYNKASIFFNFGVTGAVAGVKTYFFDDVAFDGAAPPPPPPSDGVGIDFDGPGPFVFNDFEGGVATVIANPDPSGINVSAQVAQMQKFTGAAFAGSTLPLGSAVDFSKGPAFTMKVWSARPVPVTFKLEGLGQERVANHSGGSVWQELCFDFTNLTSGPAATGITFIFDNGAVGNAAGDPDNWTFFFDGIEQVSGCTAPPPPPAGDFPTITFDDPAVTYTLTDFGGNASVVTNDPAGGANQVVQIIRGGDAQDWAGTTVSTLPDQAVPVIPFTASSTRMTVRTYSPDAGIKVRLKVEKVGDPTISVETEATTTVANGWETLTFDFANPAAGTAALNLANTYNKASIFFNFGVTGAVAGVKTYFFDDIAFGGDAPPPPPPPSGFPTITFDDPAVTYTLTDFGGNASAVAADPAGGTNQVARIIRGADAQDWAGTTVSTLADQAVPVIPFTASSTRMTVRTYSPDAGIKVRLKVEKVGDPTISVETEATTTVANGWETLTFDFANPAAGTAALNLANTYNKASIFFNFGVTGAVAGVKTYFFDDIAFGGDAPPPPPPPSGFPTITFDDPAVTYTLTDFGGNASALIADPAGGIRRAARTRWRGSSAELMHRTGRGRRCRPWRTRQCR
jgi:hypothetical protein